MKKILAIFLFIISFLPVFSENKHVLRIGAGATSVNDLNYNSVYGPLLCVEYQYNFSRYAGIYSSVYVARVVMPKFLNADTYIGGAVGLMITPLPQYFRYIKFGVTFLYNNHSFSYGGVDNIFELYNQSRVGLGFPIRAYLIDSPKYELSVGYDILTVFKSKGWVGFAHHMGMQFGVKF